MEETTSGEGPSIAQQLFAKLEKNKASISINRVPLKTLEEFKALASDEYCDDYGMALKGLMDLHKHFGDIVGSGMPEIIATLASHEQRLEALERWSSDDPPQEEKKSKRRMLDGTERVMNI